jgi:hypothetical protein
MGQKSQGSPEDSRAAEISRYSAARLFLCFEQKPIKHRFLRTVSLKQNYCRRLHAQNSEIFLNMIEA